MATKAFDSAMFPRLGRLFSAVFMVALLLLSFSPALAEDGAASPIGPGAGSLPGGLTLPEGVDRSSLPPEVQKYLERQEAEKKAEPGGLVQEAPGEPGQNEVEEVEEGKLKNVAEGAPGEAYEAAAGRGDKGASAIEKAYRLQYSHVLLEQLGALEHQDTPTAATIEKYLTQFGYDIFAGGGYGAPSNVVLPPDYVLGPGDTLRVNMWGSIADVQFDATIKPDGTITLPKLGVVPVAGYKYGEIKDIISAEAKKYYQGLNLSVTVLKPRSLEIYVMGQVARPGLKVAPPYSTVLNALAAAGGPLKIGSLRNIAVIRQGKTIARLDLYDIILKGDASGDIVLEDKDVVHVPYIGATAAVLGAVRHPAIFELKNNSLGVKYLLGLAGGSLAQAQVKLNLRRFENNRALTVLDMNLDDPKLGAMKALNGDLLEVRYVSQNFPDTILVTGYVWGTEEIEYKKGLKLSQVVPSPEQLRPQTNTALALLHRYDPLATDYLVRQIPLMKVWEGVWDLALKPKDKIEILPMGDGLPAMVRVFGHLFNPLEISYQPGMRVSDVLPRPAELKPGANLRYAMLRRYDPATTAYTVEKLMIDEVWAGKSNPALRPYDNIEILKDAKDMPESVRLMGHVFAPIELTYQPGMRVSDILPRPEEMKPDANLRYALLTRYDPATTVYSVEKLMIDEVWAGTSDPALRPYDNIEILKNMDEREPVVRLSGHVITPLALTFKPGMRLSDILPPIEEFKPGAILDYAILTRYDQQTTEHTTSRIPLAEVMAGRADVDLEVYDTIEILAKADYGIKATVYLRGAVWKPGMFEYQPGLTVKDLIALGGGLKSWASTGTSEITRKSVVNNISVTEHFAINLNSADINRALEPFDILRVPVVKDAGVVHEVEVTGEVRYPGVYSIRNGERISEVIERAGGFLPSAYLYGAQFFSPKAKAIQQKAIDDMIEQLEMSLSSQTVSSTVTAIDRADKDIAEAQTAAQSAFIAKLKAAKAAGRVAIKLVDMESFAGSPYDFELEDGAVLNVPRKPAFVNVLGSVYSPNSYLYDPNLTVGDYLKMAGGPTKSADEDFVTLHKANGEVVSINSMWDGSFYALRLMPGDSLLVPEDLERVPGLRFARDVSDVIYKITLALGVITGLLF